jgi:hypothetical protein
MATRLEVLTGSRNPAGAVAEPASKSRTLSLEERLGMLHRRRRVSRTRAYVEGVIWFAGSGAILFLATAGVFGFR